MQEYEERLRLTGNGVRSEVNASGLLGKALTFASGAVLLIVGLMFSLLVFALAATVALVVLGYLWWKTRELRRQMREQPPAGRVIEGEVIRNGESREQAQR